MKPGWRPHDPDAGVAGERTDLAWNRTGLAVLAILAALARRLWPLGSTEHVVALVFIAIGASAWASGLLVARSVSRTTHHGRLTMDQTALKAVTAGTVLLAVAGFAIALFPPH